MKFLSATLLADFYKLAHREMYPEGTELVYSTWTPRASRMKDVTHVVSFGTQAFIKEYLVDFFNDNFFNLPKDKIVKDYSRIVKHTLGIQNPETKHIEDLHDLGYLPLLVRALPEGTRVPLRTPTMTIQNTDNRFFWLTNYIETLASCSLWQASTSATIAYEYRKILDKAAMETVGSTDFVQFQGHDFSMRGMSSLESAVLSGMGHLLSFTGTDTVPAIQGAEHYYGANVETELVGTSVPATEHSIQCAYGNDMEYLERMLSVVHPSGIVSIVSDGYDFWDVIRRVIPALKDKIMARTGGPVGDKVVIRPDSGDPVKIICGDEDAPKDSLEYKGAVEALWDIFGGTYEYPTRGKPGANPMERYKVLDSHIGLIYGDAITLNRAKEITSRLKAKGFASTNVVFGIGSYSYQYNTRDTFGYALKSTLTIKNGQEIQLFKDPKTDDGTKKSQKGRVAVLKDGDSVKFVDCLSLTDHMSGNMLLPVFENGVVKNVQTFAQIRERLKNGNL